MVNNELGPNKTVTVIGLTLGTWASGIYHGFMDARGIPLNPAGLETILTYWPTLATGIYGGLIMSQQILNEPRIKFTNPENIVAQERMYNILDKKSKTSEAISVGITFGVTGIIAGGLQTLLGYGVGYTAGKLSE